MAWDLTHVRLIERAYSIKPTDEVKFAMHVLLTFDRGLIDVLKINPIEQFVIYKNNVTVKFKKQILEEVIECVTPYLTKKATENRRKVLQKVDYNSLKLRLENELLELCKNY